MRFIIFSISFFLLFSYTHAQTDTIYLDYDYHSKKEHYYYIQNGIKKVLPKGISTESLKKHSKIRVFVRNLNPEYTELFFKLRHDSVSNDRFTFDSGLIQEEHTLMSGLTFWTDLSKNVTDEDIRSSSTILEDLIASKGLFINLQLLNQYVKRIQQYEYPFNVLNSMYIDKVKEYGLEEYFSIKEISKSVKTISNLLDRNTKKQTIVNLLSNKFLNSTVLASKYRQKKQEEDILSSKGTGNYVNHMQHIQEKFEDRTLPFFENIDNLDSALLDFIEIYNFHQTLNEENYSKEIYIDLDPTFEHVDVWAYSKSEEKKLLTFSVNPKSVLRITTSYGVAFSRYINERLDVKIYDGGNYQDSFSFKKVDDKEYFPAIGTYTNLVYMNSNSIYNVGFSIGLVVPLQQLNGFNPSLSLGPTLMIGQGEGNKLSFSLTYGLSPRLSYNQNEIELDYIYQGDPGDYFEETLIYEPTISFGVSYQIGSN